MKKIALVTAFVFGFSFSVFAQVLPKAGEGKNPTILVVAPVKKGEGCMQATARTEYPLSKNECAVLLEKHGMYTRVDGKNIMAPVSKEAIVPEGTVFVYVVTDTGKGWTLADTN